MGDREEDNHVEKEVTAEEAMASRGRNTRHQVEYGRVL